MSETMCPVSGLEFICDSTDRVLAEFMSAMYLLDSKELTDYSHLLILEDSEVVRTIEVDEALFELAKRVLHINTSRLEEISKTDIRLNKCRFLVFELIQQIGIENEHLYSGRIFHTFEYVDKALAVIADKLDYAKQLNSEMMTKLIALSKSMQEAMY